MGNALVTEARKWIDVIPYEWGDKTTLDDLGMDCSGFVDMVFDIVTGSKLSEGKGGTYYQLLYCGLNGEHVGIGSLLPGDVVFLDSNDPNHHTPDHVGIATGEGSVVECRYPEGVVETKLAGSRWETHWHSGWRLPSKEES